jgi:hypothetical protein
MKYDLAEWTFAGSQVMSGAFTETTFAGVGVHFIERLLKSCVLYVII